MNAKKKKTIIIVFVLTALIVLFVFLRIQYENKEYEVASINHVKEVKIADQKLPDEKDKTQLIDELNKERKKKTQFPDNDNQYMQAVDLRRLTVPSATNPSTTISSHPNKTSAVIAHAGLQAHSNEVIPRSQAISSQSTNLPELSKTIKSNQNNAFGTIKATIVTSSPSQNHSDVAADFFTAQVYGDQKIQNNTALVVRNTEEVNYNDKTIPINSIFFGKATFSGNRVMILLTKVKTPNGEFPVRFSVMDNDRIEGLYYKAPLDEVVDNAQDDANTGVTVSSNYSLINSTTQGALNRTKELLQKSRTLTLEEGYLIYIVAIKEHKL